ncbi:MAG: Gfo/Idh/MocA family oxidoreductase [Bosea sp.]|nr:Gfo/Idh/MocA family oxidoreductase [Bosea sp. (in: a-proteobacteria)]
MSDWHLRDGLAHLPEQFAVLACCDPDPGKRQDFARRYGVPRAVGEIGEVLAIEDVDVVTICTPPSSHYGLIVQALAAGKSVVCEKPLTSSLELVDRIIEAQARSPGRVMPIFQNRFGSGVARARHIIQSGLAGRPYLATVETAKLRGSDYYAVPWRGKFATELGGVLLTQAIHNHDLLVWLLGPVAAVSAYTTTLVNPVETEDCAAASLVMRNGSLATLAATQGSVRELARFRLCFEHVVIERTAYDASSARPGDEPWHFIPANDRIGREIDALVAGMPATSSGFVRQYELFHEALINGTDLPVTLEDARRSLELITALYDSAEHGRPVTLPIDGAHPRYGGWLPSSAAADHRICR